ncbi:KxYKxGKxW signal peptide domain-containing protein [Weissella confusa]|uniref:mucin-binding protein n=1 Tax=Weissella confusa TaxID=1583 RepID=UPI0018F1A774|nr:KxYKxGKxW signal peptide domain-containing protein [Weissella confusa]MBJ7679595.1 KxYKxGKxW signal peptide domain-containing protein [Weissella confusa]
MKMNLQKNMFDRRLRYKMYKDGKKWVFASMATLSLIGAFLAGGTAHADDQDVDHSQTVDTSEQGNAPNSESVVVLSATPASSDTTSESVVSSASEASSSAQTSSADAKGETSASLSAQSEALQSSDARTGETRSVASETSATSSVATSSVASSASQASSVASSTASSTAVLSVASSAAGASYSVDSAKSVAVVVTSLVAEMHSVAAADSAAAAVSDTDNIVHNTAMDALVNHAVEEAEAVAQTIQSAQTQSKMGQVENANSLMLAVYSIVNTMTNELQAAIQMVALDKRGVVEDQVATAKTAYASLDASLYNATFALSAYGDLIVNTPLNQFATVVAGLKNTGIFDDFRYVVDPTVAQTIDTVVDVDKTRAGAILAYNDTQFYNEFMLSGSASKPYKWATLGDKNGSKTSTVTTGTSTEWTASINDSDMPTDTGSKTALASTTISPKDGLKIDLTGKSDGASPAYAVAGAATYKNQLSLKTSFTITGTFNMANHASAKVQDAFSGGSSVPAGDFLGIFLTPEDPGVVGGTNGDMGIGGLKNSISFGFDFFYNAERGDQTFGTSTTNATNQKQNYPIAGFRTTDADGTLQTGSTGVMYAKNTSSGTSYSTTPLPPAGINGTGMPFFLSYDANSRTFTAWMPKPGTGDKDISALTANDYQVWTYKLPSTYTEENLSLGLLGVTGGNGSVMYATLKTAQSSPISFIDPVTGESTTTMHFSGSLNPGTFTVDYVDDNGNHLLPQSTITANVGDKVGITNVSPNYNIDTVSYDAPTSIDSTKYKLKTANDVTVSGTDTSKNKMTLTYETAQKVTVKYAFSDGTTVASHGLTTDTVVLNGWSTEDVDYNALTKKIDGYTLTTDDTKIVVTYPKDGSNPVVNLVFSPNKQSIVTSVTGLPSKYADLVASETTTISVVTGQTVKLPDLVQIPGYTLTVKYYGTTTTLYSFVTPGYAAGAVYKYTYDYVANDAKAKVYFTYTDPDTGNKLPINTDLIKLKTINGLEVHNDRDKDNNITATYVIADGKTDQILDPTNYENVAGGFTWDGVTPAVTTFNATSSSSMTLNFTEQPVIATVFYFVNRNGEITRFAPLGGTGTSSTTFIYKGYANTAMPKDPTTNAQLYPSVSGYTLTKTANTYYTDEHNPLDIATDTPMTAPNQKDEYDLPDGTASIQILDADSQKNYVFVVYQALEETATVKYVDQNGNPVPVPTGAPTTLTGFTGDSYTKDANYAAITPAVKGYSDPVITDTALTAGKVAVTDANGNTTYKPQAVTVANAGVFGSNNSSVITVTYKAADQTANVNYVDDKGNPVVGMGDVPTTLTGTTNSSLSALVTDAMKKAPAGYTYVSTTADTTFDNDDTKTQQVTVLFKADTQSATVHYVTVDGAGKKAEIANQSVVGLTGTTGALYNATEGYADAVTNKAIAGYTRVAIQDGTGKFVDGTNDIYVVYTADESTLHILYYLLDSDNKDNSYEIQDRANNDLQPNTPAIAEEDFDPINGATYTGVTDGKVVLQNPAFKGYTLVAADTDLSGLNGSAGNYTLKPGTNFIWYYFKANPQVATLHYQDENGNKITGVTNDTVTGNSNTEIPVTKTIPGWTLKSGTGHYYDDDDTTNQDVDVVFAPDKQQEAITVTYPAPVLGRNATLKNITTPLVVNTSTTGTDFQKKDLSTYIIPGYTMLVNGVAQNYIGVTSTDTTDNGLDSETDTKPQVFAITYKANAASLTTNYYLETTDGENKTIKTTTVVPGMKATVNSKLTTDEAVTFTTPDAPAGYELVAGDTDYSGVNQFDDGTFTAKAGTTNAIAYYFKATSQKATVSYKVTNNDTTIPTPPVAEVTGVTGSAISAAKDYATAIQYKPAGYTFASAEINGKAYTSVAAALAAADQFAAGTNTIVVKYTADTQTVTVNFRVNKYQVTSPTEKQSTDVMPASDQVSFTFTGTTGQTITLGDVAELKGYLASTYSGNSVALPGSTKYVVDSQVTNPLLTDKLTFDNDDSVDQPLTIYYTGTSVKIAFIMLTTDTVDVAFDANGNYVGIPASVGHPVTTPQNGVSVVPLGMGGEPKANGQVFFTGYDDLQQSGVKFVLASAGSENPWTEKMTVSGVVSAIKVTNGQTIATVGSNDNPAQITYDDGTTQIYTSKRPTFSYTLKDDELDAYNTAIAEGKTYTVSHKDIGWELFRNGYIDGVKYANGVSYGKNNGDESIWALAYTTVPSVLTMADDSTNLSTFSSGPIFAYVYYPKTAQETVQINYVDAAGNPILNEDGTPKTAYMQGTANTEIDYSKLSKKLDGYNLVSDGTQSVTTFDTVGTKLKVDPTSNKPILDADGNATFYEQTLPGTTGTTFKDITGATKTNYDATIQTVNLVYAPLTQDASVVFQDADGNDLKAPVNLPSGATNTKMDLSAITDAIKTIPGYHIKSDETTDVNKTTFDNTTYDGDADTHPQHLVISYVKDTQDVTVNYVLQNADGSTTAMPGLKATVLTDQATGAQVDYSQVTTAVPGYALISNTTGNYATVDPTAKNADGTPTWTVAEGYQPHVETVTFKALTQAATVNFVDENGKALKPAVNLSGLTNAPISYASINKAIAGYHIVEGRDDTLNTTAFDATTYTGATDTTPQQINVVYAPDNQEVVVNYLLQKADGTTTPLTALPSQTIDGVTGGTIDVANVTKSLTGYTLVSDGTTGVKTFDSTNNGTAAVADDAAKQTINMVFTANATKVNVVYRVMLMTTDAAGNPTPLQENGHNVYTIVTPSVAQGTVSSVATGVYGDQFTVDTSNQGMLNQGYYFDSVTFSNGEPDEEKINTGLVVTYPNGSGVPATTNSDGSVTPAVGTGQVDKNGTQSITYTFSEQDEVDNNRTVYVTYKPEQYSFDIVYLVVDPSTDNPHGVLVKETGFAGGFYSYDSPTLPIPAYITAGADQGNLNGPYGPQVNGFNRQWDASLNDGAGGWTASDNLDNDAHLVITYTPKTMSVTANYVLVNADGEKVTDADGNPVFISGNAVKTGPMGNAITTDGWHDVLTNGNVDTKSQVTQLAKTVPGYRLQNADGTWTSTALTFDFDAGTIKRDEKGNPVYEVVKGADGVDDVLSVVYVSDKPDGELDIVPATWQQYEDYAVNIYEPYRLRQNDANAAYNKEHDGEIRAGKATAKPELKSWNLDNIADTWANLGWTPNNEYDAVKYNEDALKYNQGNDALIASNQLPERNTVDATATPTIHKFQPAINYVTYDYKVDPTITYTYKDSAGTTIDKGQTYDASHTLSTDASIDLFYSDGTPALMHYVANMPANGGGAYTITDTAADIAGYARSDKGSLTFNGNAYVASGVLPSTNFDVTFTAVPQPIVTTYVSDSTNPSASAADMPAATKTVRDTDKTYVVTDGKDATPAGYYVSQIVVNKGTAQEKVLATASSAKSGLTDTKTGVLFTGDSEKVVATSVLGADANTVEYVLTAAPQDLHVTYGYTNDKIANWQAPAAPIAGDVVTPTGDVVAMADVVDTTVATAGDYTISVPKLAGYTAQVNVLNDDGTIANTYTADQFADFEANKLAMVAGGAKYAVIYTPIAQTVQTNYVMPTGAKAISPATTTKLTVTDAKYTVTTKGGTAIPAGYYVSEVTFNGKTVAKANSDMTGLVVNDATYATTTDNAMTTVDVVAATGDEIANKLVYVLAAIPEPLQVTYSYTTATLKDWSANSAPKLATNVDTTVATDTGYTVSVPVLKGYNAVVTAYNADGSVENTYSAAQFNTLAANGFEMDADGAIYKVVYTPIAENVKVSYTLPKGAPTMNPTVAPTEQAYTDAKYRIYADGPLASSIPNGYQVATISINGGDPMSVADAVAAGLKVLGQDNTIVYNLKASLQKLTVNYVFDASATPTTASKQHLPGNDAAKATVTLVDDKSYSTGDTFKLDVPSIPGYTPIVTLVKDSKSTTVDSSLAQTMTAGGAMYTVTYMPTKQQVQYEYQGPASALAEMPTTSSLESLVTDQALSVTATGPLAVPAGYSVSAISVNGDEVYASKQGQALPFGTTVPVGGATIIYTLVADNQPLTINNEYFKTPATGWEAQTDVAVWNTAKSVATGEDSSDVVMADGVIHSLAGYDVTVRDEATGTIYTLDQLQNADLPMAAGGQTFTILYTPQARTAYIYFKLNGKDGADMNGRVGEKLTGYADQAINYATYTDDNLKVAGYGFTKELPARFAGDSDKQENAYIIYTAKSDQKAKLSVVVNGTVTKTYETTNGVTATKVTFTKDKDNGSVSLTDSDLPRKGYEFTLVDNDGDTTYKSLTNLPIYTDSESDERTFEVRYTSLPQSISVQQTNLPTSLMNANTMPKISGYTDGYYGQDATGASNGTLPTDDQLKVAGYTYTIHLIRGGVDDDASISLADLATQQYLLKSSPLTDDDLQVTGIDVVYKPDFQSANVKVENWAGAPATITSASATGTTGSEITLLKSDKTALTDADLTRPGYTYLVNGQFATLAAAQSAVNKFDNTDNVDNADATPQTFTIVYTAKNQSVPFVVTGLPAAKVPNLANLTGVTDQKYVDGVPTEAQLKVDGYKYTITPSNSATAISLADLSAGSFTMDGTSLAVTKYTVNYEALPATATVKYQFDSTAAVGATGLPEQTTIKGTTDGAYPVTSIPEIPGYTILVTNNGTATGQYNATDNTITGTFAYADDTADDDTLSANSVYTVTYVPTDQNVTISYHSDDPDATNASGSFTLPAAKTATVKTDMGYLLTSQSTPGYTVESVTVDKGDGTKAEIKVPADLTGLTHVDSNGNPVSDSQTGFYYLLDTKETGLDGLVAVISNDGENVSVTNKANVYQSGSNQSQIIVPEYVINLMPTQQTYDVVYKWADDATGTNASENSKTEFATNTAVPATKIYTDHNYGFTYALIPGYTATVTGVAHTIVKTTVDGQDVSTPTDVTLSGAFTDDTAGKVSATMHAANVSYVVAYTADKQSVGVSYDVSGLSAAEVAKLESVTSLPKDADGNIAQGSLTGLTDAAYSTLTSAGAFDYTEVKKISGYTYKILDANGDVVTAADGTLLQGLKTNFDFKTLTTNLLVDASGKLINPSYQVVYTPDEQDQMIVITTPADKTAGTTTETTTTPHHANTDDSFEELNLTDRAIPGYTMLVDGQETITMIVPAEMANDTDVVTGDTDPQTITVTYQANHDQRASLTFYGRPSTAPTLTPNKFEDGEADSKIAFGLTQGDLYLPGYTFTVTMLGDAKKTHVNIDNLYFTRDEDDKQQYVVTYKPKDETVDVKYKNDGLTTAQQNSVPGSSADFTLTGLTDTTYASAAVSGSVASNAVISAKPGYTFDVTASMADGTSSAIATSQASDFNLASDSYSFAVSGVADSLGSATSEGLVVPEIDVTYTALPKSMTVNYSVSGDATATQEATVKSGTEDSPKVLTATTDALLTAAAATSTVIRSVDGYTFMIYKRKADGSRGDEVTTTPQTKDFDLTKNDITAKQLFAVGDDGELLISGYDVVYTADTQKAFIVSANDPDGNLAKTTDMTAVNDVAAGTTDADISFEETDATLARHGYTYTVTVTGDETVYGTLAEALAAHDKFDRTNNTDATDSDAQIFTVKYTADTQTAKIVSATDPDNKITDTTEADKATGASQSAITFTETDDTLKRDGYTYTVMFNGTKYATLADALEKATYDRTDIVDGTDSAVQEFTVTYTADTQTAKIVSTTDPDNKITDTTEADKATGASQSAITFAETDDTLKRDGYTYTVKFNGKDYANLAAALNEATYDRTDIVDGADSAVQMFTVTYTANPAEATVTLVDEVTGKVLGTMTLGGVTNQVIDFTTVDEAVKSQEAAGYHVVENQYDTAKQSDVKFDVKADTNGATQQWMVRFNHKTTKQESTTPVKKTTTFVVDGTTKTPSSITPAPITQTGEVTKHYPGDATKTGDDAKTPINPDDTKNFTNETGDGSPDKVTYTSVNTTHDGTPGLTGVTSDGDPIFDKVTPPDVPGYTPSAPVTDDNGNQVVTYKPDTQTANIVYKDKLTDEVLHTDTPSGLTDHDIDYSTADEIATLKEQGYNLVSDGFIPGTTYTPSDNTYYVILNHAVTLGTEPKTVTKKITYVVDGGDPSKAPKSVDQTVTVERKFAVDKVKKTEIPDDDVTSDNYDGGFPDSYTTTGDSNDGNVNETTGDVTFNDVTTPEIPGYTAKVTTPADPGSFGRNDVTEVVTYTPNDQTVKVHYDNTNLTPNQQHSVPGGESDFTMTGKTDTPYDTATVNGESTTVPAVPGYTFAVMSNGKTIFTSDDKNPTYDFKTVTNGHKFTVTGDGLTDGDYTITYTPKTVTGQVVVIDDATKQQVQDPDNLTGETDTDVVYDSAATIKKYRDKGYVLVSNDLSEAKTYNADNTMNHFEIHLKHRVADGTGEPTTTVRHTTITTPDGNTTTVEQVVEVTPHYSVDQVTGERVPDDDLNYKTKYDKTETPWFEPKDTTDKTVTGVGVTGFDEKTGTPTFGDVTVPDVPGYTVVRTPVDTAKPNGDQTVTYKANDAKAQVVYVDDTTNATLRTDDVAGVTDEKIDYNSDDVIKDYVSKGYVLVSDGFAEGTKYDNVDDAQTDSQVFEIHLKHDAADGTGTPTTTVRHTTITTPDGKKTTVDQTVEITPHYSVDQVTGERVPDGDLDDKTKYDNTETPWFEEHDKTPDGTNGVTGFDQNTGTPTFGDVDVPEVPGYTPVRTSEPNGDQTVTYVANYVTGKVVVIDDVTGATLRTDDLAGKTDANVDYDSAATIKNFTDKGYVLVSNDLSDAKTYNFDAAKNVFEIHLKHDTMDGTGTPTTVVRHTTIQTPDGKTVTVEQIVEVTPHYSVDKVTGERVPDDQLGDDTKYANTETPWFESHDKTSTDITGMTGFDEKTGTPTFGEVAGPNIPGYKMVRTNEPNGDQVVTFVPDGSAVVETSNNVQPVATVATPQTTIATPSRMTPMNNVVAGTPAPTTNTVDGELPVFVETVDNTPVVNKDNLWIHEIPDDKDGDIANLNSLNDMSWRTSDPYLVAMLIAALAAAGMFGVLLAFYRRREAVERKLAERRED